MSNKKAPQAAEAAQGTNTHIQDTTEAVKSQIDFTELEELVYNAKAYTELLYGLALAEDVDGENYNAVDFLMRQMSDHANRLEAGITRLKRWCVGNACNHLIPTPGGKQGHDVDCFCNRTAAPPAAGNREARRAEGDLPDRPV